ncbi:LysR family transcriptional regulator [Homoserinimonas sp. OAct 916]|uniref:LysR family transcriptional regulator n=1 Tax=Homoserinimonas sp. OAct 916 TaxID=2211450 RepID=UPI000DBE3BB9|nr:LysR family transcriptional regulator [Homoserinimonas sp. OAct 916]
MIEIKHLRLVRALAEHGSLSAAARALGYSQPAVTQQLQRLEALLETPLITRTTRGVHLTGAGDVLLKHATSVLSTMSLAQAEVEAVAGLRSGRVRVAAFPSAAATLIPPAFAAMTREHPGILFTLLEALPDQALQILRNGDCDIALVYRYTNGPDATEPAPTPADEVTTGLLEENVHVALPASHPAAIRRTVRLDELRDDHWIAGCPSCRGNLVKLCSHAGFDPNIAFDTDDYVALQGLVAAGLGVALVPDLMLAAVRPDPGLVLKRISTAPMRTIRAVSSASLLRVPGVAQTVDALGVVARDLDLVHVA